MFNSTTFSLLGGKFQTCVVVSTSALALTAIPVAFTHLSSSSEQYFRESSDYLSKLAVDTKEHFKNSFSGLENETHQKAEEFGDIVSPKSERYTSLKEQAESSYEFARGVASHVKENIASINYYLFSLGNIIKPLIKNTGTIIKDTSIYNKHTKTNHKLLAIQKFYAITQQPNFKSFAQEIKKVIQKHSITINQLTQKEGLAIIKIFREVREKDFNQFMGQIVKNIRSIVNAKESYSSSRELLEDIFIGQKNKDMIKALEDLKKLSKDNKDKLQGVSTEELIKRLEVIIKEFEEREAFIKKALDK